MSGPVIPRSGAITPRSTTTETLKPKQLATADGAFAAQTNNPDVTGEKSLPQPPKHLPSRSATGDVKMPSTRYVKQPAAVGVSENSKAGVPSGEDAAAIQHSVAIPGPEQQWTQFRALLKNHFAGMPLFGQFQTESQKILDGGVIIREIMMNHTTEIETPDNIVRFPLLDGTLYILGKHTSEMELFEQKIHIFSQSLKNKQTAHDLAETLLSKLDLSAKTDLLKRLDESSGNDKYRVAAEIVIQAVKLAPYSYAVLEFPQ